MGFPGPVHGVAMQDYMLLVPSVFFFTMGCPGVVNPNTLAAGLPIGAQRGLTPVLLVEG